jgi:lactose/L-arabinose transport system permease protein
VSRSARLRARGLVLTALLAIASVIAVFPYYWLVVAATHSNAEIFSSPPRLLPGSHLAANLANLQASVGILRVVGNSVLIATCYTAGGVLVCGLAGYAFAKYRFRGRDALFLALLATLVVPSQVTLVPLFKMMLALGWLNTYQSIILPSLALPFGIFLMRQACGAVPDELLDAARVDGCGELRMLPQIVVPVLRAPLATLAIFLFLFQWNDFTWPLIALRTGEMYTLPVALASLQGLTQTDYGQLMAGTALAAVPIAVVFLFLQRYFVAGLLAGSVKG